MTWLSDLSDLNRTATQDEEKQDILVSDIMRSKKLILTLPGSSLSVGVGTSFIPRYLFMVKLQEVVYYFELDTLEIGELSSRGQICLQQKVRHPLLCSPSLCRLSR